MQKIPTAGTTGLFSRIIRVDFPESAKRAQLIVATVSLVVMALPIAGAITWRIFRTGDVGMGAVYALTAVTGPLAILAGAAYRKIEAPPAENP